MDSDKYDRSIEMSCQCCGGQDFEFDEDTIDSEGTIRCVGCNRLTTKDELVAENESNIDAAVEEIGDAVINDMAKSFGKLFKGK